MATTLPFEATAEQLEIHVRDAVRNPNVGEVYTAILKRGIRSVRIAAMIEIVDHKTGEHHHNQLTIWAFKGTRNGGWVAKPEQKITLDGQEPDEISALLRFVQSVQQRRVSAEGNRFHVVAADDYSAIANVLETGDAKAKVLGQVFREMEAGDLSPHDWLALFHQSDQRVSKAVALAARMVEYKREFLELRRLVHNPETAESQLQALLKRNPWMFGSEYSELLDRRNWTRDDRLDFMLRRTADGYLEVLEIKRPFKEALFRHDRSHDSYFPSSELSPVLGQVIRYIEEVEKNRAQIFMDLGDDPLKIRARVVVGRDGGPKERQALRNLNAHLHGIEVLTFDDLLRIARRVLSVFAGQAREVSNNPSP